MRYHGDETAVSCPVSRVPISLRLPSLLDQAETEFLSPFLRGGGCNEDVVVTVDHKPSMTQPDGALVKESQG